MPVDLDEAGLEREIQAGRHFKRQWDAAQAQLKQKAELDAILEKDPLEYLRRRGKDPDRLLLTEAQRHAQQADRQAQLAQLPPEIQEAITRAEAAETENQQLKKAEAERVEREAQQREERRKLRTRETTKRGVFEALKASGLYPEGTTPQAKAARGRMLALTSRMQMAELRAGRPEMTPQQLAVAIPKRFIGDASQLVEQLSRQPEFRTAHAQELAGLLDATTTGLEGRALLDFLGQGLLSRIIAAQTAVLHAKRNGTQQAQPPPQRAPAQQNGQPVPLDIFALQRARQGR